jgi:hypothetical protein
VRSLAACRAPGELGFLLEPPSLLYYIHITGGFLEKLLVIYNITSTFSKNPLVMCIQYKRLGGSSRNPNSLPEPDTPPGWYCVVVPVPVSELWALATPSPSPSAAVPVPVSELGAGHAVPRAQRRRPRGPTPPSPSWAPATLPSPSPTPPSPSPTLSSPRPNAAVSELGARHAAVPKPNPGRFCLSLSTPSDDFCSLWWPPKPTTRGGCCVTFSRKSEIRKIKWLACYLFFFVVDNLFVKGP